MEQTKGYLRLEGKIWALNNKEAKEFDYTRNLSFGIQTSKENSIFVQVGEFKNSSLNVKIKTESDGEVEEINEQDAIDVIKKNFKDGESVYINARVVPDTYRKSVKYLIGNIYKKSEPIDFDSSDFEEVNELKQPVVITEKPENGTVKAGIVDYKGNMVELELKLIDEDVAEYFNENAKVGDLFKVTISVNRKPKYVDKGEESERKTLKGKTVKSGGKKIDGYVEYLEVTDVDIDKIEKKKYDREDIRKALELAETKSAPKSNTSDTVEITDDDLPF